MWLWFALGVVLARGYQRPNFHRSNDTGLWRGSNDSQKATVRNCQRRLAADTGRVREVTSSRKPPCESASGGTPARFFEGEISAFGIAFSLGVM